jgi:hypothetical protein
MDGGKAVMGQGSFGAGLTLVAILLRLALPAAAAEPAEIKCAPPFAADASQASLVKAFGRKNVVRKTIDGPEGTTLDATLIYPNDPARRLIVLWQDEAARTRPSAIIVRDNSKWMAPGGIGLGATLDEVSQINGEPFNISGFDWDYGGSAGFENGALADLDGGCVLGLTFALGPAPLGPGFDAIIGDRQISSDDPLMVKAAPSVVEMSIGYPAE